MPLWKPTTESLPEIFFLQSKSCFTIGSLCFFGTCVWIFWVNFKFCISVCKNLIRLSPPLIPQFVLNKPPPLIKLLIYGQKHNSLHNHCLSSLNSSNSLFLYNYKMHLLPARHYRCWIWTRSASVSRPIQPWLMKTANELSPYGRQKNNIFWSDWHSCASCIPIVPSVIASLSRHTSPASIPVYFPFGKNYFV